MASMENLLNRLKTQDNGNKVSGKPDGFLFYLAMSVLFVVEIGYLVYCLWLFTVPLAEYEWSGSELESRYGVYLENFLGEYGDGFYLDNSLHADEDDEEWIEANGDESKVLKISTPMVDLRRGSYKITVNYSSNYLATYSSVSDYSTFYITADKTFKGFSASEDGQLTFYIFTPIAVEGYQVQTNYLGTGYLFVSSVSIQETQVWKQVHLALILFIFLSADILLLTQHDVRTRWDPSQRMVAVILVAVILFSSSPIFIYYIYGGSDLSYHLNRIEAIKTALLEGQFPVRVSSYWCNGYGYASSVLYGDFFLYFPALLRIIGFTVQDSYKIYVFLVNTATCLISYYSFHKISGSRLPALTGSILYTLSVYRLINVYTRAAVGEFTAMVFLPLIAYGLWRIYTDPMDTKEYRHNWVPAVLGYSGVILSHIISTFLAGIFTIILCLVLVRKTLQPVRFRQLLKVVVYTLLLTLWFVFPFIDYFRFDYEVTSREMFGRVHANSLSISELLNLFPDATGTIHNISDNMNQGETSYNIGGGLLSAGCFYLLFRVFGKIDQCKMRRIGDIAFALGILALFMCTSLFPWDFLQQMNGLFEMVTQNIQFPWRILGIASLAWSLVAVCLIDWLKRDSMKDNLLYVVLSIVVFFSLVSSGYMMSSFCQDSSNGSISLIQTEEDLISTSIGTGEYLPSNTNTDIFGESEPETEGRLTELTYFKDDGTITISCQNQRDSETYIDVPFLYYKGYHAVDAETGEELVVIAADSNKVRVIIPEGYTGTFYVRFMEPWYWRICEMISATVMIVVVAMTFIDKSKRTSDDGLAKQGKGEQLGTGECMEHV